jgi:hypothetical protein
MLAEIEDAIVARLTAKAPQLKYVNVPHGAPVPVTAPSYLLTILKGNAGRPAMNRAKQEVGIKLWVRITNLKDDATRRKAAYPLLEAVAQLLFNERLGLDITHIAYEGFVDITEHNDWSSGIAIFEMSFSTSYTVEKISDEAATDLLSLAMNILLDGKTAPVSGDIQLQDSTQGESND